MLIALAAAISALLAIAADWNERRHKSYYVLKPLTSVLILAVAAASEVASPAYQQWILLALGLSLVGDVCLMFKGTRWFAAGLGSFLLAHLAFAAAFLLGIGAVQLPAWLLVVPLYGAAFLYFVLPRAGALKLPVLVYALVLGAMVFAAAARYQALGSAQALLALSGALLFLLSDSLLSIRQFLRPYRHAQALILSTYWAAIGLIAWSV